MVYLRSLSCKDGPFFERISAERIKSARVDGESGTDMKMLIDSGITAIITNYPDKARMIREESERG